MYLKKIDGPRSVTLPGGEVMTRADLPKANTKRWVASRKEAILKAIHSGLITKEYALETYGLSDEELSFWEKSSVKYGISGLKATNSQKLAKQS